MKTIKEALRRGGRHPFLGDWFSQVSERLKIGGKWKVCIYKFEWHRVHSLSTQEEGWEFSMVKPRVCSCGGGWNYWDHVPVGRTRVGGGWECWCQICGGAKLLQGCQNCEGQRVQVQAKFLKGPSCQVPLLYFLCLLWQSVSLLKEPYLS